MAAVATSILDDNLRALSRASPDVARRVRLATPRRDVRFMTTDEIHDPCALAAEVFDEIDPQSRRALCSRRRPLEEARRLIDTVDIADAAVFLVSGFAAGHHVRALAERLKRTGIIVVFEPDLALLRAVLEHIDCSAWLGSQNVAVVDDPDDGGALARVVEGVEGLVAMGVTLVEHPASRARLADGTTRLHARFLDVVKAVKMTVVTTLVQVKTTLRNLTQNLDRYVASPGIVELKNSCKGRAAIIVSAGPSLARNIALLEDPRIRERFAIIAVQTVLKPLLARGIRPHFVTALDYSEISARFYEGLTAADLSGISLIIDPKVNPGVVQAWPRESAMRVQGDKHLDKLLGADLAREKGALPAGATVAHMAYYFARHLGCDPVAFIGQDLGFTDGQYYAPGAAIHTTWACELNEFNTLEMLEWQRILRMGQHLRKTEDVLGRPIYTDEQMATYLMQFERDFKADADRGLTTIDATEGGVRKQHSTPTTLRHFIGEHRQRGGSQHIDDLLSHAAPAASKRTQPVSLRRVEDRVVRLHADTAAIADLSRNAGIVIAEMLEHHADQPRVNRLIGNLEGLRDSAVALQPAFDLTQTLNQTGMFNRLRADRALQVESNAGGATAFDRQRKQLDRDAENVRALADAADDLHGLLGDSLVMLRTGKRVVREQGSTSAKQQGTTQEPESRTLRLAAVVPVYADHSGLDAPMQDGRSVFETTLSRLAECRALGDRQAGGENPATHSRARIILLTDVPDRVESLRSVCRNAPPIEIVRVEPATRFAARRTAVQAARLFARDCWRGGIGNQSIYDEVFDPAALRELAHAMALDAILLVGPDWCALDPSLCDRVIERHLGNPGQGRFAFTQAPPGLCGCVLSRTLLDDFAAAEAHAGALASIGGLLGYIPQTPIVDLINLRECVEVEPRLRDMGERVVGDSPRGRAIAHEIAGGVPQRSESPPASTTELVLHLGIGDIGREQWLDAESATAEMNRMAAALNGERGAITLRGGDPLRGVDVLAHPSFWPLVERARDLGLGIHVRSSLTCREGCFDPQRLAAAASGISILSVDLLAESDVGYRAITSRGDWPRVRDRLHRLIQTRASAWSLPWIVPRLTRCDAAYTEVDPFFRQRIIQCGWAVIDPLEAARTGERIAPLPMPSHARMRLAAKRRVVHP